MNQVACICVCVAILLCAWPAAAQNGSDTGFIAAIGQNFADKNCNNYAYSGANVWQVVESEGSQLGGTPQDVDKLFTDAKSAGINNIRFFPFGITGEFTLQTAPGQYNQRAWDALDSIIKKAGAAGIKLIMPFADNWTPTNGKYQYVQWCGQTDPDTFFTNDGIKTLYKNHIRTFLNHVNSQTQVAYKDDPTVFAWDLMNEVRSACNTSAPNISCTPTATAYVQSWLEEMSSFVKSIDSNHMLTTGEEGFYAAGERSNQYNPGGPFAAGSGQDFVNNHRPAAIDYAVTHVWVDNWGTNASQCTLNNNPSCGPAFIDRWLTAHEQDASSLNKPFVIEEFGNSANRIPPDDSVRLPIFRAGYTPYESFLSTGSPNLHGIGFWAWTFSNTLNQDYGDNTYVIKTGDSTWTQVIQPSFAPTQQFNAAKKPVPGCTPGAQKATGGGSTGASPPGGANAAGRRLMNSIGV